MNQGTTEEAAPVIGHHGPESAELTPIQKAYALLWREMRVSDRPYVAEARKVLLASLTHAEQYAALAWVQRQYPLTDREILENDIGRAVPKHGSGCVSV